MLDKVTTDLSYNENNSLLALGSSLWRGKWTLIGFVVAFVVVAVIYLNVAAYKYTANMNVTAIQSSSGTSKLGGLAGLASIAGVSLPQDSASMSFLFYTEGFRSKMAAEALAKRPDIMRVVFEREWDAKSNHFVEPGGPIVSAVHAAKSVLGLPQNAWRPPDAARLQAYLQENIKIIPNPKSPVTTIIYSHPDPHFAELILFVLNGIVDDSLRQKSLQRSTQYIAYLNQQLRTATIIEHRAAIALALSEQEKQRMFASSTLPFAAEPFGGIVVSLKPTSPQPPIVLLAAVVAGLIVGATWIIVRGAVVNDRARARLGK